ncbi:hypothetical protein ACJW30_01G346300 [Castanea mollissima]
MESSSSKMSHAPKSNEREEYQSDSEIDNKLKEIISSVPGKKGAAVTDLYQDEGFWCPLARLEGTLRAQRHFKPQPNQVILSSFPKSGTTWLKALIFAIMTKSHVNEPTNPLLTRLSHECVPFIEFDFRSISPKLNLDLPLVATHISYTSLLKSIIDSGCKIVYLCKDPKDVLMSTWHFIRKVLVNEEVSAVEDMPLEDAFEFFCQGLSFCGPYWDHLLGILFLKYEDLKNETVYWVKKIARFIGYPFSLEEEDKGVVQKIIDLCSFENMSSLEVSKSGMIWKGKVGDWKNHLTHKMAMQLDQIFEQKLTGSGLTFTVPLPPSR